jgi:hypothetical protein
VSDRELRRQPAAGARQLAAARDAARPLPRLHRSRHRARQPEVEQHGAGQRDGAHAERRRGARRGEEGHELARRDPQRRAGEALDAIAQRVGSDERRHPEGDERDAEKRRGRSAGRRDDDRRRQRRPAERDRHRAREPPRPWPRVGEVALPAQRQPQSVADLRRRIEAARAVVLPEQVAVRFVPRGEETRDQFALCARQRLASDEK